MNYINFRDKKWTVAAIASLVLFRLFLQFALYKAGFASITADEFGRTVMSAHWSKNPTMYWYGPWMPFHTYLFGTALFFKWELLWVPRLITILAGSTSIVFMYLLASNLFENRIAGLASAFLLSVNPAHIWLSGTPLTEMPNAMFVFAAIWAFSVYLKNANRVYLFIATGALTLANGFRFDSWLFSILFTLFLLYKGLAGLAKKEIQLKETINLVIIACIPWIFPIGWVIGNYIETQNPLFFATEIKTYKSHWYGEGIFYRYYVDTFLKIDPYLTFFGIIGVIVCLLRNKKSKELLWYVMTTTIPLAIYIVLHGGQLEPSGNYIRYFALYSFFFYPALVYLLVTGAQAMRSKKLNVVLLLFVGLIGLTQIRAAFRFTNDGSVNGLAVGQEIRELRAQNPEISDRPIIIELSFWEYLAIHVGANDLDHIIYDRTLDFDSRNAQPLLLTDERLFRFCLKFYNVSYIVVKDTQLKSVLEDDLQFRPVKEINNYAFYPTDTNSLADMPMDQTTTCPLFFGSGYWVHQ